MPYRVLLKRSAEKELDTLPRRVQERVLKRLLALESNPRPRGTKTLTASNAYRLRVGDYRLLYEVDDENRQIEVFAIGHRREVYR